MNPPRSLRIRFTIFTVCLGFGAALFVHPAKADPPASLDLVPADAAFYSASTHLREQYDSFVQSRAFAKLMRMPIVQMGFDLARSAWNDPEGDLAPFKAEYEKPENRQLVELLIDAVSHEVFVYGDGDFAELFKLLNDLNQANQAALRDISEPEDGEQAERMVEKLSQVLAQHLEKAQVPDTVIGFRLSDTKPAIAQLTRLEQVLGVLLADHPDLKSRITRTKIAGGEFVTMQLDGSLIPWDEAAENAAFDISRIRDKVSKMTASIAVGVKGGYLIVSLGDNNDHLAAFGQGDVLAGLAELAPIKEHARKKICSVSYFSAPLMREMNSYDQQLDQLVSTAEGLLPLSDLDAEVQSRIIKDVRGLVADIKAAVPELAATTTLVFINDRGYEGYSYNWSKDLSIDASKPLTILNHVGGDPILAFAGRGKYSPESYDTFAKWIGRAIYYAETIGVERLGADERDFYHRVRDDLAVLVKQLDEITRAKMLPAFRDGQHAFVMDAKVTSTQWHNMLTPTDEPLPMLELGLVCGVSNQQLVKEAAAGYFQVLQKIIDTLHEAEPTTIPEFPLPAPDTREFPNGTVYYYRLPRELGLDKQVSPNAGLSDDALVLSMLPKTTVRLLEETPLQEAGVIKQHAEAAGVAVRFSFARLIDAVAPWVDYGIELSGQELEETILDQIHTGLEIARCLRDISTVTYQENDVWATHFEVQLQDLPAGN